MSTGALLYSSKIDHSLSITPLRAALHKRATEELVNTRPNVGSTAAELDITQLQEDLSIKADVDRQRHSLMSGIAMRSQRAYEEHNEIIDEIRSGNADGAARAMNGHVNSVLELDERGQMKELPDFLRPN